MLEIIYKDKRSFKVTEEVKQILENDALAFGIIHESTGKANVNKLINEIIEKFSKEYQDKRDYLKNDIYSVLNEYFGDDSNDDELFEEIIEKIIGFNNDYVKSKKPCTINFRINDNAGNVLDDIFHTKYDNDARYSIDDEFLRNLVVRYCQLSKSKREQIIFRDKFKLINKAILENNRCIDFKSAKGKKHIVRPYAIVESKVEFNNYLICGEKVKGVDQVRTYRIAYIKNINILDDLYKLNGQQVEALELMKQQAPEFSFDLRYAIGDIEIKLTSIGAELFNNNIPYRPIPFEIDSKNNIYKFKCTYNQIFKYFATFGKQATILKPNDLKEAFDTFYLNYLKSQGIDSKISNKLVMDFSESIYLDYLGDDFF